MTFWQIAPLVVWASPFFIIVGIALHTLWQQHQARKFRERSEALIDAVDAPLFAKRLEHDRQAFADKIKGDLRMVDPGLAEDFEVAELDAAWDLPSAPGSMRLKRGDA
jgi:hypothetical protein